MPVTIVVKANGTGAMNPPTGYAMEIYNSSGKTIASGWGQVDDSVNAATNNAIAEGIKHVRGHGYTDPIDVITDIEWLEAWVKKEDDNTNTSYAPVDERLKLLEPFAEDSRDKSSSEKFHVRPDVEVK